MFSLVCLFVKPCNKARLSQPFSAVNPQPGFQWLIMIHDPNTADPDKSSILSSTLISKVFITHYNSWQVERGFLSFWKLEVSKKKYQLHSKNIFKCTKSSQAHKSIPLPGRRSFFSCLPHSFSTPPSHSCNIIFRSKVSPNSQSITQPA